MSDRAKEDFFLGRIQGKHTLEDWEGWKGAQEREKGDCSQASASLYSKVQLWVVVEMVRVLRRSGNWVGSDLHSYMESHGVHYMQGTSDYATRTAASQGDPSSVNLVVWIRGTIRILRLSWWKHALEDWEKFWGFLRRKHKGAGKEQVQPSSSRRLRESWFEFLYFCMRSWWLCNGESMQNSGPHMEGRTYMEEKGCRLRLDGKRRLSPNTACTLWTFWTLQRTYKNKIKWKKGFSKNKHEWWVGFDSPWVWG